MSEPGYANFGLEIFAVEGPKFVRFPDYPTLRVVDFEIVGDVRDEGPGYFEVRAVLMLRED